MFIDEAIFVVRQVLSTNKSFSEINNIFSRSKYLEQEKLSADWD